MVIDLPFVVLAGNRRNRDHVISEAERCGEPESVLVDIRTQQKCRTGRAATGLRRFKYGARDASLSQRVCAAQARKTATNNGDVRHVVALAARILSLRALLTRRSVSDGTV